MSPSAQWAFHSYSSLDTPPVTELVKLPAGEPVRLLAGNAALKAKVDGLARRRVEFFRLPIGGGTVSEAWAADTAVPKRSSP